MSATSKECEKETIRQDSRSRLEDIQNFIIEPQTADLEPELCKRAGIVLQAESLSLDETSNCRPIFFDTYKDKVEDPTDDTYQYEEAFPHINQVHSLGYLLDDYLSFYRSTGVPGSYDATWDSLKCPDLFECEPDFEWVLTRLSLAAECFDKSSQNPALPHVKCIINHDTGESKRLLRGEILVITTLMMCRLHERSVDSHLMAPILAFSIMGPWHLRVLEAYFDGNRLVVRSTPLYDMRRKRQDRGFLQSLTRWWLGHCVGETEIFRVDSDLVENEN